MEPFQVFARIRPLNQKEINYCQGKMSAYPVDEATLAVGDNEMRQTQFQVDQVFGQSITNQDIFQKSLQPLVSNFLGGINSTVLAYGITGAGKSHTMFGSQGQNWQAGLIELTLQYLFGEIQCLGEIKVSLSYMQIYNEQVFDLLRPKSENLQILDDPVLGVVVNELEEVEIHSSKSARALIQLGNTRRMVAETKANEFSSRSHAIVQISIERTIEDQVFSAKLSLVDLAGSERQTVYSDQKGIRNLEGSNINRSLLTLGNCITALSERKKGSFVPYRDSKLTRLLKDSLGGNTKTVMIACISPSILSYDETLNTMKYACRARKIEKVVHQNIRDTRSNSDLKKQIDRLKKELESQQDLKGKTTEQISREEMQKFIHRLIKNVQKLTTVRLQGDSEIESKMKQIQLIEQQRNMINQMLGRCSQNHQETIKFRTTEIVQQNNYPIQKSISTKELNSKKKTKNTFNMNKIPQIDSQKNFSSIQLPSRPSADILKGTSFVRGNLQNVRLKHQQQKKNIRELVSQYVCQQAFDQDKQTIALRARELLNQDSHFLGIEDRKILEKIVRGEMLDQHDLAHYNVEEKVPDFDLEEDHPFLHDKKLPPREPNNRFLSSLQQVRRMMRRVSGTINKVQEQEMRIGRDQMFYLDFSKQLLFDE